ncbi:zinc finger protein jing isoform X3 [Chelonus insularis]|uniref:zinc finger protein jing isoform X3 n=1 Tax=Chelonus insularis TaxID=460826 RepID=UPI00158C1D06|nr:zinc finger protein jing isoform X3 [Chelonus insularis]
MADWWSTVETTESESRDNRLRRERRRKRNEKNQLLMIDSFSKDVNSKSNYLNIFDSAKQSDNKQINTIETKTTNDILKNINNMYNDDSKELINFDDQKSNSCKNEPHVSTDISSCLVKCESLSSSHSSGHVKNKMTDCKKIILKHSIPEKQIDNNIMGLLEFNASEYGSDKMEDVKDSIKTIEDSTAAIVDTSAHIQTEQEACQNKQKLNNDVVVNLGQSFKGQIRMAEETLIGPCGKKRCSDRYDSSESSDSGVVVSCGECSSSGTSDITEPGSPCSTSSDEGLAVSGKESSSSRSSSTLSPSISSELNETRSKWSWDSSTDAVSPFPSHKQPNQELKTDLISKINATDVTTKTIKNFSKTPLHQQESQGKITEFFKTQIKPQGHKTKKNLGDMSVLVAKHSLEFRRPLTVHRNVGTLTKKLNKVDSNNRLNDWNVKATENSALLIKKLSTITPRVNVTKLDKMLVARLSTSIAKSQDREDSLTPAKDEEDEVDDEDSPRNSESKELDSPILSEPTTIRFPARIDTKSGVQVTENGICRWDKCEAIFECSSALLEHLQSAHINTQTGGDNFVCQWLGCKVQGRTSCSRRWLERHVLSHGGNKPFRCIVDGCGSRFSSQITLERHVNSHFNQPETSNNNSKRSCENSGKLVRRNGKKLRYRRQPWSARLFDYFDTGVMEGLQHRLLELAKSRTHGFLVDTPGNSMALTSQVLAKRVEMDGKIRVLLRWYPQNIVPDEWVLESEVQSMKHIKIRKAATTSIDEISLLLYPAMQSGTPSPTRVKQRRKPSKFS